MTCIRSCLYMVQSYNEIRSLWDHWIFMNSYIGEKTELLYQNGTHLEAHTSSNLPRGIPWHLLAHIPHKCLYVIKVDNVCNKSAMWHAYICYHGDSRPDWVAMAHLCWLYGSMGQNGFGVARSNCLWLQAITTVQRLVAYYILGAWW